MLCICVDGGTVGSLDGDAVGSVVGFKVGSSDGYIEGTADWKKVGVLETGIASGGFVGFVDVGNCIGNDGFGENKIGPTVGDFVVSIGGDVIGG